MKLDTVSVPAAGANATSALPLPGAHPGTGTALPVHPAPQQRPPANAEAAMQAAARINEFLKSSAASVEFTVEAASNRVIVRVVDSATHQVIRQMPTEETLAISHALDHMIGLLFAQRA
jgi:flagellar protein FlaG